MTDGMKEILMKTRLIAFLLLMSASCVLAGDKPLAVFTQANDAYAHGQYQQAINLYESLVTNNETNATVFFNLGNAYFKNQQIGKAIVNLERAVKLSPRDKDARYNLQYLRSLVKEPSLPFFETAVAWINGWVSLNELTAAVSLFFIAALGLLIGYLLRRNPWCALCSIVACAVLLAGAVWLGLKIKDEVSTRWAIVVTGTVDARNGPGTENSVAFSVPEGRKLIILGENNTWNAVGLPREGITGWVEKRSIEAVTAL